MDFTKDFVIAKALRLHKQIRRRGCKVSILMDIQGIIKDCRSGKIAGEDLTIANAALDLISKDTTSLPN